MEDKEWVFDRMNQLIDWRYIDKEIIRLDYKGLNVVSLPAYPKTNCYDLKIAGRFIRLTPRY